MIAIPNTTKPKNCLECWSSGLSGVINCEAGIGFHNPNDDLIPPDCPLIEIDENDPMLLEFLNEFDKWRAYKEFMDFIRMTQKKGEANEKHR